MIWVACAGALIFASFARLAVLDRIALTKRCGSSQTSFVEAFRGEAIPESVIKTVFEYYANVAFGTHVSINPDDTFESLRVGQDDLEDDLLHLMAKLELEMPSSADLKSAPKEFESIRDVVVWLGWVWGLQRDAARLARTDRHDRGQPTA